MPVHFYSPIPDTRDLFVGKTEKFGEGIDLCVQKQKNYLQNIFPKYREEYQLYPQEKNEEFNFYNINHSFINSDPKIYHCMIREYKPDKIIEVGSGFSTMLSLDALELNKHGKVTCIEPYPKEFILETKSE